MATRRAARTLSPEKPPPPQVFNAMWGTRESKGNLKRETNRKKEQKDETKAGGVNKKNTESGVNLSINSNIRAGFGWLCFVNAMSWGS